MAARWRGIALARSRLLAPALALVVACSGLLTLGLATEDLEPWPEGFRVIQTASVIEAPPEGGSGPDREAQVWLLESTAHTAVEDAAAAISNHLEAKGWRLGPTFDPWPSYVGVLEEPPTIVMIGSPSSLRAAAAPANAAGATALDQPETGEGPRVVVEIIAR